MSADAKATTLSELRTFHRCYSQITGSRAGFTHPVLLRVSRGEISGVAGCLEVLDKARLITSGVSSGRTQGEVNSGTPEDVNDALNILRTFHQFHRTWFSSKVLKDATNAPLYDGTDEIFNASEAADHISRALFHPTAPYSDVVTGTRSLKEIRDSDPTESRLAYLYSLNRRYLPTELKNFFRRPFGPANEALLQVIPTTINSVGILRGIRELDSSESNVTMTVGFSATTSAGAVTFGDDYANPTDHTTWSDLAEVKFRKSYGGGAMGSQSYLMLNMGAGWGPNGFPRATGGIRSWRRISRNALSDFMCRSLPVATGTDAAPYVRSSSPISFRKDSSCMSCHSTIDGMAGVFRNFSIASTVNRSAPSYAPYLEVSAVVAHPTIGVDATNRVRRSLRDGAPTQYYSAESDLYGINVDAEYFKRPPNGRFILRDLHGELINRSVYDIEGLGQAMAQTDDLYVCAAKRYVQFLTGYDASMLAVPSASAELSQARQIVIELGQSLKAHQSLRRLIEDILRSPLYREVQP